MTPWLKFATVYERPAAVELLAAVSMVPLLAARARVLLLSCSRESLTRRRRRESSWARRFAVSAPGRSRWPGAGEPRSAGATFRCRAGRAIVSP